MTAPPLQFFNKDKASAPIYNKESQIKNHKHKQAPPNKAGNKN